MLSERLDLPVSFKRPNFARPLAPADGSAEFNLR